MTSPVRCKQMEIKHTIQVTIVDDSQGMKCDAAFFIDQAVALVGSGDAVITEALWLTKFASKVVVISALVPSDRL